MRKKAKDDFYVGYQEAAPADLARFIRGRVGGLLLAVVALGALLTLNQGAFIPSRFEYGNVRTFEGWVVEKPYPVLRVLRPGGAGESAGFSSYYLVQFGKHGAQSSTEGLDGRYVSLSGTLVYHEDQAMIEVVEGSVTETATAPDASPASNAESLGQMTLRGEIVDSKCYLGVMKPGNLKPHRACAALCIRGGIPPVLLVRDAEGYAHYLMLVGRDGRTVNQEVLDMIAEPLEITGEVVRHGNLLTLLAEPASYRRL